MARGLIVAAAAAWRTRAVVGVLAGAFVVAAIAVALAKPGDPSGLDMVAVPAGSFLMGSPPTEWQGRVDEVQHPVRIGRPFLMSRHEITQRQWTRVMSINPSYLDICPDCPVERVSWFDAVRFCNVLSRQQGLTPAYEISGHTVIWRHEADGFRLPTEAEWEYACRGGVSSAFAFGDCLATDQANFKAYEVKPGCAAGLWRGQTVPVGSFPANAFGLHDMHGNVAEWVWDRYGPYPAEPVTDPRGGPSGDRRVFRGGGFDDPDPYCRSAFRPSMAPRRATRYVGFRIVRNAS